MFLRSETPIDDVYLLADVADALKHSVLKNQNRAVSSSDAVLVTGAGYGETMFGEGKFGGTNQILVLSKTGTRALSSILQNVIDAWRSYLGWHMPEIGRP